VYLVDRRLDMLPALLSEQLCSLRADVDRLAVSVLWTLWPDLGVRSVWFGRSVIRWAAGFEVLCLRRRGVVLLLIRV
jgi:DIS3-like exonuclease 1